MIAAFHQIQFFVPNPAVVFLTDDLGVLLMDDLGHAIVL